MSNTISLDDKAQIALDALRPSEQKKVESVISQLHEFPGSLLAQVKKIKDLKDYFIIRIGYSYRLVFQYANQEVKIIDIVNRERLDNLFSSVAKENS